MSAQPPSQPTPGEPAVVHTTTAQPGDVQPSGSQGDTQTGTKTSAQTGNQTDTQTGTQAGTLANAQPDAQAGTLIGIQADAQSDTQPTQASVEPVTQTNTTVPPVGVQTQREAIAQEIDQEIAAKLRNDPMHITHEDAARAQSAEQRALGHRPPHGSVAAQAQSQADRVDNFHAVADAIQQEMKTDPSHVTSEEARHVLSAEHKALGHYPPKDSISAEAQRLAAANEHSVGTTVETTTNTDTTATTGATDTKDKVDGTSNIDGTANKGTLTTSSNNENNVLLRTLPVIGTVVDVKAN